MPNPNEPTRPGEPPRAGATPALPDAPAAADANAPAAARPDARDAATRTPTGEEVALRRDAIELAANGSPEMRLVVWSPRRDVLEAVVRRHLDAAEGKLAQV